MFIKKFTADDWQSYKALRLEALSLHADVYGSSYEVEAAWRDAHWQQTLGKTDSAYFGLCTDQGELIGITAIVPYDTGKDERGAMLTGLYIRKDYRGQKFSHLLYSAGIEWARKNGSFDVLIVGHRAGIKPAERASQAFGFRYVSEEEVRFGDGSNANRPVYELKL